MSFLPAEWEWEGLSVRDVREDEVDLVSTLHMRCSEFASVDKSFIPVSMEEYDGHVRSSLAGQSEGSPFRL